MTEEGAAGEPRPGDGKEAPATPPAPARGDGLLLAAFAAYAVLLLVAAYAQLHDDRDLLDLFDFRRWFTR